MHVFEENEKIHISADRWNKIVGQVRESWKAVRADAYRDDSWVKNIGLDVNRQDVAINHAIIETLVQLGVVPVGNHNDPGLEQQRTQVGEPFDERDMLRPEHFDEPFGHDL